jgi:CDP-glucose 4,6-dehydratase
VNGLLKKSSIEIRNPNAIRPWQHVLESAYAYLLLGMKTKMEPVVFSDTFNFGPNYNDTLSVLKMVELAIDSWGGGSYHINSKDSVHEANLLKLDISKAKDMLKWAPRWDAQTAIDKTLSWYKYYDAEPGNIEGKTEEQINDFFN